MNNIYKEILDDLNQYIRKGLNKGIFSNPRIRANEFIKDVKIASRSMFVDSHSEYEKQFQDMVDKGEYGFYISNFGAISYNYEFKNTNKANHLHKMSLSYYPEPILDIQYIRVDYDPKASSFFHSDIHVHIGLNDSLRIPLNRNLKISEFVNLIFYFYSSDSLEKILDIKFDKKTYDKSQTEYYSKESVLSNEIKEFIYLNYIRSP